MPLIHFYILQTNGHELKFDLAADARVLDLKQAVANSLQVPLMCQKFVMGTEVLRFRDFEKLSRVFEGDMVTLTLVLDTEAASSLVTQLDSPSAGKRVSALEGLADIGSRCRMGCSCQSEADEADSEADPVVERVRALVETDDDPRVRRAAAYAVSKVATSDDDDTIELLIRRSSDEQDQTVYKAVMIALGKLAGGSSRVSEALSVHLNHTDASIRRKGLTALAEIAQRGDQQSVTAARELLKDADSSVRWEALRTLTRLTLESDRTTIAEITTCLDDKCCFVRGQALACLQKLSPESVAHLSQISVENTQVPEVASGHGTEMPMEARFESQPQASTVMVGHAKEHPGNLDRPRESQAKDADDLPGRDRPAAGSNERQRNSSHPGGCQINGVRDVQVQRSQISISCCSGIPFCVFRLSSRVQ
jgi:hypothetical protein